MILWMAFFENYAAGTDTRRIITDASVDASAGLGIIACSTAIGSAIGSVVPVAGNIVGAAVGYVAGWGLDYLANTEFEILGDESVVDWVQEGVDIATDWIVEDLPDIASDAWKTTTDFAEDAGDWIENTASDAWEATTDFFEDAGNAIGNFFSGIFG